MWCGMLWCILGNYDEEGGEELPEWVPLQEACNLHNGMPVHYVEYHRYVIDRHFDLSSDLSVPAQLFNFAVYGKTEPDMNWNVFKNMLLRFHFLNFNRKYRWVYLEIKRRRTVNSALIIYELLTM